jgi:outer membrane protein OmpA-like peptidoglycan-associated protein
MKKTITLVFVGALLFSFVNTEAQSLKKIGVKFKEKTERAGKRSDENVNKGIDKAVDDAFDSAEDLIENDASKKETTEAAESKEVPLDQAPAESQEAAPASTQSAPDDSPSLWTKYDFVPGDTVIFEDILANEQNGEFPSKWDLKTGNAEIAEYDGESVINFPSTSPAEIVPLMEETGDYLSEKFTIEFDAYFSEFCTSYHIKPRIQIDPKRLWIDDFGGTDITENKNYPYWQRVAISFNIRSLKIYFGEQRVTNIPNLKGNPTGFSIRSKQCHDGQWSFIKNIRIAKGSMSLYDRVVTDGKFITNGIRFDVGKATIRPESMGVINQIHKLLNEHSDLNFSVEGHTDSDGDDASNQKLSEERAAAVKSLLVEMGVDASRISTKGFGESIPLDSNGTSEGKANNRRVEFIKI